MAYQIDENLHTIKGEIPKVHMDTLSGGGIHLWLKGQAFYTGNEESGKKIYSISVHLSREQAVLLAKEILYRVMHEFQQRVKSILIQEF